MATLLENGKLDVVKAIDSYLNDFDWRTRENSNIGKTFQGLMLYMSGTFQAKYCLEKYPTEIRTAHLNGDVHIHDLSFGLAGYCAGWSLYDLLLEGFNCPGFCCSGPAKHFEAALGQMVNFLGTLQNEWAGAQAFNNVDTYLAPFIYYDNLSYNEVKQSIQKFIYNLNTTSRWGGQSPFTNLSLDLVPPKHLAEQSVVWGGKLLDDKYGDFIPEIEAFNTAFLEIMKEGDYHERIFSFPIPTYNVTSDFPWDTEVGQLILEVAARYGVPYFQNFINSDLNPEDVRSMCCRLRMDLNELRTKTGGLFGAGDLTGSIGVVTMNLPRMAYLARGDRSYFFTRLERFMDLAKDSLEMKRGWLEENKELFPFSNRYLKNGFNGHFSTIGLIGGNEACATLLGEGIHETNGLNFMSEVLDFMRDKTKQYQDETGHVYNLEATPAEGAAYRLARLDKSQFPTIYTSGYSEPYYTNSTMLPVDCTSDVFEAVVHQDELQPKYTGGTVFHVFLGEAVADPNSVKGLLLKIMNKSKLPYVSITPTFSVCPEHGYLRGEQFICPYCNSYTEVYSRIVGYYRPISAWNRGKREEYKDRVTYKI